MPGKGAEQGEGTRIDPFGTMLSLEELNELDDISGSTLYSAEVRRIPLLSREEQQPLIEKAKQGDKTAKDALVMHCLIWSIRRGAGIYKEKKPQHLDLMDLVGVANVEIMEKFERALEKGDPVLFLLSSAAYEMQSHASNRDALIPRPRYGTEKLKRLDPIPATSVSLEATITNGKPLADTLPDRQRETQQREYRLLHEAINALPPARRSAIIETFGLFGQPAKTNHEIAKEKQISKRGVNDAALRAKRELAEKLAPYRTQLTRRSKRA